MPCGVAACAIEVWVCDAKLFGFTFFSAPGLVGFRVHQMVQMLKFWIAPQFCVNTMVKLCCELVGVGAILDYIINGFNIDESCAGAGLEAFQDVSLGKGPACRLGRVEIVCVDTCHQTVWAWAEHASHSCVDDVS